MLFPPVFAADMADTMKQETKEVAGDDEFQVLDSSKDNVGTAQSPEMLSNGQKIDSPPGVWQAPGKWQEGEDKSHGKDVEHHNISASEDSSNESDQCGFVDQNVWEMPEEAWKTVLDMKLTAPANRVRMGGIAMQFIESEGKSNPVPKKRTRKHGNDTNDDIAAWIQILLASICKLSDRCDALEEALKQSADVASSSKLSDVQATAEKKNWNASSDVYDLPTLQAWSVHDGKCDRCEQSWSHTDSTSHFAVDDQVWETIMKKMFADWSRDKMYAGQQCRLLHSYIHTASNVATSLAAKEIIREGEITAMEERLRNQLFQPDIRGDRKALWLYYGGEKDRKYLTFGCIHCHRARTLYYSHEKFHRELSWYF